MTLLVRRFAIEDANDFAGLNLRWIEEMFGVEESDRKQLEDPLGSILKPGGVIAVAELDGRVVGCGALVPPHHAPDDGSVWLELVKMATDPDVQRNGIGSRILDYLIDLAKSRGCEAIWLETNDQLDSATRLYERKGFRRLREREFWPTPYMRCNLQMVLDL